MTDTRPAIVWFRQDLRLKDNPALTAAADSGRPVVPVFVQDDESAGDWRSGAASRWWLQQSLTALNESLQGQLRFHAGRADDVLPELARRLGAGAVFWNRGYEPWRIECDRRTGERLSADGLEVHSFNGTLLTEPHTVAKGDGTPYRVYTPYFRECRRIATPAAPLATPELRFASCGDSGMSLGKLGLMPAIHWYEGMAATWQPGEAGALARLDKFIESGLAGYRDGRDRPDRDNVSRLSPHLHFGEVSPWRVWHAVSAKGATAAREADAERLLSQLGWRDFSYYLLYHWPDLPQTGLQRKFDRFPWRDDAQALARWQQGLTGIPMVDAGMRELWQTGYMHNRVRMVTASFLVKNLMLHWRHGEDWFHDTLVDADLANNAAGWQWVAGCGADAAPYFRIFNPVTQGRKFDPDGTYVRHYVPELAELPLKYLHAPWEAPDDVLEAAGVRLDRDYPAPIVDLRSSRERALDAFRSLGAAT